MGFLDPTEQIVDLVLTPEGKKQLASGDLSFEYFSLHDDEIDYRPLFYLSSSFTDADIESITPLMIEDTPILEAIVGRSHGGSNDSVKPTSFLFDSSGKDEQIPSMEISPNVTGSLLTTNQQIGTNRNLIKVDRSSNDFLLVSVKMINDSGIKNQYVISLFESGSDGLNEIFPMYDSAGRRSYGNDFILEIDSEIGSI